MQFFRDSTIYLDNALAVETADGEGALEEGFGPVLLPRHLVGHVQAKHVAHLHHSKDDMRTVRRTINYPHPFAP